MLASPRSLQPLMDRGKGERSFCLGEGRAFHWVFLAGAQKPSQGIRDSGSLLRMNVFVSSLVFERDF